jgi:hypothetical protein
MAWLLVGSIPGVLIGANMSIKVPERSLRVAFGVVLLLSGLKVMDVPHANGIVVAVLVVAAVGFAVQPLRRMLLRRPTPVVD